MSSASQCILALQQRSANMPCCSTSKHSPMWSKKSCLRGPQEDVYYCSARMQHFVLHKTTLPLAPQEDTRSFSTRRPVMLSCSTRRRVSCCARGHVFLLHPRRCLNFDALSDGCLPFFTNVGIWNKHFGKLSDKHWHTLTNFGGRHTNVDDQCCHTYDNFTKIVTVIENKTPIWM